MVDIDSQNNTDIIRLLKINDIDSFELIYNYFFKPLCSFASQYVSIEDSEEVVQETMLWLWENRENIIEEMSLKSLLFTIVKNKCLNKIKSFRVRDRVHNELVEKHKEEFENPNFYLENELHHIYQQALNNLPPLLKEVFEMSREKNLTHKEIAAVLEVSPQTVNYRLGKTLSILRDKLKDYLPVFLFW